MDFTYDQPKMRTIAVDRAAAQKLLGNELAEAFLSLVADMRNAMYLGELIDAPASVRTDPLILEYELAAGCILEVQPIGVRPVDVASWADVHRVKLVRIIQNGMKIL